MFDPATAALLRSAPGLPGLDADDIPQVLTAQYAELVSARLRGAKSITGQETGEEWSLERIADTYEIITSVHNEKSVRLASAFVAATAQQILAKQDIKEDDLSWNVTRDRVDPAISAALLFLAAEQYADANEAAASLTIKRSGQPFEVTILVEHIRDLARGQLHEIVNRSTRWRKEGHKISDLEEGAFLALIQTIIFGLEWLAADILLLPRPEYAVKAFESPQHVFIKALDIASNSMETGTVANGLNLHPTFPGPRHLASLMLLVCEGVSESALTKIRQPHGVDEEFWQRWISLRARNFPFVWPNHREALSKGFHEPGNSSVLVLPTGAGKTTVASLKIAAVLASGKQVIFLAPTHALVDQLSDDLQEIFPKDLLGSVVSSDFDLLLQSLAQAHEIEVMTPERCLAMLSFAPEAFDGVGLLVFDECHLLSPQSGKIRRALDGMLCILAFNRVVPDADLLFLSAMLKNGEDFGQWISSLTGRNCVTVDLLWKPSRQARGVVVYKDSDLLSIRQSANRLQLSENNRLGKIAKGLRAIAENELKIRPYAIWGLQHNWLKTDTAYCIFTAVSDSLVQLSGELKNDRVRLKPNSNEVSAHIAATAAKNKLKTIVFVNQKSHAVSTARQVCDQLGGEITVTEAEQERWDALQAELGHLKHSLLEGPAVAVPHNASMLRLERELAERMYRRQDGAKVIVATPTLAQGLNLPAELAIIAGDKRADPDEGGREDLEAHEILNAAARAGRAGHLANGVVLLIPEPILKFSDDGPLENDVVKKLQSVLPEDDRCVVISDPLEVVLDRIMQGKVVDRDVRYTINRMSVLSTSEDFDAPTSLFSFQKSYAAFAAKQKRDELGFNAKLGVFKKILEQESRVDTDQALLMLASQSGLPIGLLSRLSSRIQKQIGELPTAVEEWVTWTIQWLHDDEEARSSLLFDSYKSILGSVGMKKTGVVTPEVLVRILPGIHGWITGMPLCEIESMLGGNPDSVTDTLKICPRARELVASIIPREFSFVIGLVSHVVQHLNPYDQQASLNKEVIECLGIAVRRGVDSPAKLDFAKRNAHIYSRVQLHQAFAARGSIS